KFTKNDQTKPLVPRLMGEISILRRCPMATSFRKVHWQFLLKFYGNRQKIHRLVLEMAVIFIAENGKNGYHGRGWM
ncbi:MAG: hypothetical protein LBK24_01360, partial [Puniceicoccales bacterium]|nr:hypothetical protein [Puniceicoccales bacterium]